MEENDFMNKMENLKKPEVNPDVSKRQMKLTLMSSRKTAKWGIWFLIIPVFFLVSVTFKELFQWKWGVAENFVEWMAKLDQTSGSKWLTPVLFVLLPAAGLILNMLAIMHFVYDKTVKELVVTIKVKWLNIILIIICAAIIGIAMLYGIIETASERAIHKMEME